MIGSVTPPFLADVYRDTHKMLMNQLMPLFGTFALNIDGMARSE